MYTERRAASFGADDTTASSFDENLASTFFGWSMAMVVVATVRTVKSFSSSSTATHYNYQMILCSSLIASSAILAVYSWIYLIGRISSAPIDFVLFLLLWSIESQVYFQIALKRIIVLNIRRPKTWTLRIGVFMLVLGANLFMFLFWLPEKLRHPARSATDATSLLFWCPKIEKMLFLLYDAALNGWFLYHVNTKLVGTGFYKYRHLVSYSSKIIGLSMSGDVLLLGVQWYPHNDAIFFIAHPVVFLSKLLLEMSICDRMAHVSRESDEGAKHTVSVVSIAPILYPRSPEFQAEKALPRQPGSTYRALKLADEDSKSFCRSNIVVV